MHLTSISPRYLRATLLTVAAVAVLPTSFLVLAYIDYRSPNWDPEGDSGAVQGYMLIFLVTILATSFTAVSFPAAANRLHRRQSLRPAQFFKVLSVWLGIASVLFAVVVSLLIGGLSFILSLSVLLFVLASVLVLPFSPLWLWLAK
jgi:hypothetical protein